MKKILLLTAAIIMAGILRAQPTLHLMMVAATHDETIGQSVEQDMKAVTKEFKTIADKLGITYNEIMVSGDDFSKASINNAIDNLTPSPDDIVAFMYCGHGFRFSDDTDEYPRMYLSYTDLMGNDYMSMSEVYSRLTAKNARLTLVFSDCCNTESTIPREELEDYATRDLLNLDVNKLKTLFLESEGSLQATAAAPGQAACCTADGGFMTQSLIRNINKMANPDTKDSPQWSTIIDKTSKYVKKRTEEEQDNPQIIVRKISLRGEAAPQSDSQEGSIPTSLIIALAAAAIAGIALLVKKKKKKTTTK